MQAIPLLSHTDPDQIVAWQHGTPITARQFLADVAHLVSYLPPAKHLLNMCSDRYHFTVGFAAAILSNKVSLLPPSHTNEMVSQLKRYAPDTFCLSEHEQPLIDLPHTLLSTNPASTTESFTAPQVFA